jgi:hypothetical protein
MQSAVSYFWLTWCVRSYQVGPIITFVFACIFIAVVYTVLSDQNPVSRGATSQP